MKTPGRLVILLKQPIETKKTRGRQCEKNTTSRAVYFEHYAEHETGRELKAMSDWLDQNTDLLDWMAADVKQRNVEEIGKRGLSIE